MIAVETSGSGTVRIEELLKTFSDVFEPPKGLPPSRNHEHCITLVDGAKPFKLKPYRFPYSQKAEIERMVSEMLKEGVI